MEGQHGCPNLHGLRSLARAGQTASRGKRQIVKDADNNIGARNFWEVVDRPNVQYHDLWLYEQSKKRCVLGDTPEGRWPPALSLTCDRSFTREP